MRRSSLILSVVVLLVAVGCGSSGTVGSGGAGSGSGSTDPSDLAAQLDGRTFDSTTVTEAGVARPMVKPVTVTFEGDALRASPGCNLSGGHFTLDGDHLQMGEMDSTAMACADTALMDQDTWFGSLFDAAVTVALVGDQLTLSSGDTMIVLVDHRTVDPDRPLIGTTWTLESINDGPTASSVPVGVILTMTIPDESSLTWQGCNTGGAPLSSMDATSFTVGDMMSTQKGCPSPAEQVDSAFREVLQGTVTYAIDGPVLHVVNGDQGLDLRAT